MTTGDSGSGGESRSESQLAGRGHVSKRGVPTTATRWEPTTLAVVSKVARGSADTRLGRLGGCVVFAGIGLRLLLGFLIWKSQKPGFPIWEGVPK